MSEWRAIGALVFFVGLVVGAPGYVLAQGQSGVGVVTTLVGEATVARATGADPLSLKMRDDVFPQDRISTKERSVVHVLMGGKALLTVRELSVLTVTEEGGRATVNLQSGKIGLAVVRQRMKPGDVIEVHTPHAVAAVRGTVLVVEIVPGSTRGDQFDAGGTSTNVHLLHGKLDVSLRSSPAGVPVRLESLQTVTVSSNVLGTMRPLSPAAAAAITRGLKTDQQSRTELPEKFAAALEERQRVLAVATAEDLWSGRHGRKGHGAKAGTGLKGTAEEGGSNGDVIGLVADTEAGVGSEDWNALGRANGGSNGWVHGGSNGWVNGPGFGPGTSTVGNGLATIVAPKLFKKTK